MIARDLNQTVGRLVAERPGRARVLERLGIDHGCDGRVSLARACAARGLDPMAVLKALESADDRAPDAETDDWSPADPAALADFIVATHHAYLRRELPRLDALCARVADAHGARHPELAELRAVFATWKAELEAHMLKEEWIVFPWIAGLGQARATDHGPDGLSVLLDRLEQDHDDHASALSRMRDLTRGYTPPPDACPTYRTLLAGLLELEVDMQQHVHRESHVLFAAAGHGD